MNGVGLKDFTVYKTGLSISAELFFFGVAVLPFERRISLITIGSDVIGC